MSVDARNLLVQGLLGYEKIIGLHQKSTEFDCPLVANSVEESRMWFHGSNAPETEILASPHTHSD
jgi:hypothetical protein